jgi:diacylglycerol O-acyltransferase / wax synthase
VDWLSAEDERILALESDAIAGHTCKLIELHGAPALSELREHVAARLDGVPRLKRRLQPAARHGERGAWVVHPDFDVAEHVREAPADGSSLRDVAARLMGGRLDRSRPLWDMHLARGHDALVVRIHHALADGTAVMRILAQLLWDDAESPAPPPQRPPATEAAVRGALRRELAPASARTPLDAHVRSPDRRVEFVSVSFADVKHVEKALGEGITVNDVLLCMVAGGLRRGIDAGTSIRHLRAQVPVSLHVPGEGDEVSNRDSFIFVDLDVAEADPVLRLRAISRDSRERKRDHDAEKLDRILHGAHGLGRLGDRWAVSPHVFALNVSNVRGPAGDVHVLEKPVRAVYALAEVAQHHALRVACMSACGQVTFGLCADAGAVERLDDIADGIEDELAALRRAAEAG